MHHKWKRGVELTKGDDAVEKLKWKFGKKLHKPLGHHEAHVSNEPPTMEMHAPDPETHAHGVKAIESSQNEPSKLCPACGSPTHAHDQKCPWCGATLSP